MTETNDTQRRPHSIRFTDGEWEQIVKEAEAENLAPGDWIRSNALAICADTGMPLSDNDKRKIARTIHAMWMLVSKTYDARGDTEAVNTAMQEARKIYGD